MLFLVLFLFYCAYFMLRYSVDEGARRERFSAIYALLGIGMRIDRHVGQQDPLQWFFALGWSRFPNPHGPQFQWELVVVAMSLAWRRGAYLSHAAQAWLAHVRVR